MCLIIVVFVIVEISSCLFQASAIVALKPARSLLVLRNSDDVDILSFSFIRWRSLDLFHSIVLVVTKCSNLYFLIISHACFVLTLIIIFLL